MSLRPKIIANQPSPPPPPPVNHTLTQSISTSQPIKQTILASSSSYARKMFTATPFKLPQKQEQEAPGKDSHRKTSVQDEKFSDMYLDLQNNSSHFHRRKISTGKTAKISDNRTTRSDINEQRSADLESCETDLEQLIVRYPPKNRLSPDISQLILGTCKPACFSDLLEMLRAEIGSQSLQDLCEYNPHAVHRVQCLMAKYQSVMQEWRKFAFFDKCKYTRNLVIEDGSCECGDCKPSQWNLLLLCWNPGQQSPIHDHAGSHCIMKILQGDLLETRYEWPDRSQKMNIISESKLAMNQAAYMSDELGLHRISNPSSDIPAVSLHLYSPPIEFCKTFCESTGKVRASGNCVYFSVAGNRCCSKR